MMQGGLSLAGTQVTRYRNRFEIELNTTVMILMDNGGCMLCRVGCFHI